MLCYIQSFFFFALLVTSFSVSAAPIRSSESSPLSLAFATKVSASGGVNLAEADRSRVAFLLANVEGKGKDHVKRSGFSSSAHNNGVTYTTSIGVGTPPTQYTLLIDTGSANTWVGANKKYKPTKSSKKTGQAVTVSYGSGTMSGNMYLDTLTLAPNLAVHNMNIGVANSTQGFSHVDGILGLGPSGLTYGSIDQSAAIIPTVTDTLFSSHAINSSVLGVYYTPASNSSAQGELSWGAPDTSKTTGPLEYVPVTKTYPSSRYWGIDQSVSYGGKEILMNGSGIVDTGTTLVLLAKDAFLAYQNATGATIDYKTGLLTITDISKLQPLSFHIGSQTYTLTPNAQIWPRTMNKDIGGVEGTTYLVVAYAGAGSGMGLDFVMGYTFLERFYSVYDTTNNRMGFAPTQYTNATTN